MADLLQVFVSSTTGDLKSYREVVKTALLDRHVHPVVKEHFSPSYRELSDYLDSHLSNCDAVVCIVGFLYGGAPDQQNDATRRSWTQLEYDYAVRNDLPLFVFLADSGCLFDREVEQPAGDAELQTKFRQQAINDRRKHEVFRTKEELKDLVLKIDYEEIRQARVQRISRARRLRSVRFSRVVIAVLLLLCVAVFISLRSGSIAHQEDFRSPTLTVGGGSMQIPVELVYTAKVGDKLAPIRVQSVVSAESTYQLPEDLRDAREAYSKEQARKMAANEPGSWDGPVFRLKGWDLSPAPNGESKILVLQVENGSYFDFVITHLSLKDIQVADESGKEISAWEKYVAAQDREFNGQPNSSLSNMFGVSLTAVTSDGYVILHRRSQRNAVVPDFIHVSVAESTKAPTDAEKDRGQLVYNTAVRGLDEELCISEFSRDKIEFLGLIYSPELAQFDLVGTVRLPFTAAAVKQKVAGCRDSKYENERLIVLPFNALEIASFMQKDPKWSPFAVASILLALNFEFGSDSVDRDFATVFRKHPVQLRNFEFVAD
ncbi:MAG: DUF4062 domain-containing protein [Planctomycetota bacterium]